jgi:hypothetical protein
MFALEDVQAFAAAHRIGGSEAVELAAAGWWRA